MRLIDADEVNNHGVGYVDLSDCPTIDAVEVIRCRYCRGWNRENGYCVDFLVTDPNGYCSFGERKE